MRHPLLVVFLMLLLALAARGSVQQPQQQQPQQHDHAVTPQEDQHAHHDATEIMSRKGGHRHDPHLKMTTGRPLTHDDARRADALVERVKDALERYKDHRVAIRDGYKPVLPQLPLPEYHFTNYWYGFLGAFTFDPAKPTSLLYKKRGNGYELAGAMFTAPKSYSEDQLHERVPLSVASWHAHVNICLPPRGLRNADWSRFGFKGSIASDSACQDANGRWFPQMFGWMLHVYPYERDPEKIWAH